jgi:hypothetical protein
MQVLRLGALALLMLCAPFCFSQSKLLIVEGTSPDFGDIYTPTAERFLTLKNIGKDTLTISGVSTSCGCTAALVSKDHIPPGQSGTVSIKFDAKRFTGPVQKGISMNTNDETQKHVNITFKANVIKSLECDPEYFFFSGMIDSTDERTITIQNTSSQTIHILSFKPSSNFISVKLSDKELEPNEEATLTGTIHPTEAGTVRGDIEFVTDFSPYPKISVGFFAYTKPKKAKPN